MKKQIKGKSPKAQKTKSAHTTAWIRVIGMALSIVTVSVVCLGAALFASNDRILVLQTDLNGAAKRIEALNAENKAAAAEISSLQGDLTLSNEELERLNGELAAVKDALLQSRTEQKRLEEDLDTLENGLIDLENRNRSAQEEIDRLKNDLETAKEEIATMKEQLKEPAEKIRIYIDQGHNPAPYHNTGASGNGLYEQDVTFLIGCLLAELLRADKRFEVQLSRPNKSVVLGTDNKSSLMARVEGAAAFEADYLISLHINSFTDGTVNGIEVYSAENGSESYVFGESLLNGLIGSTGLKDRGMKLNPDLDILEFSAMPAVLLEMGFISNSADAALLAEHPELFAQGIYCGLLDYFGFLPSVSVATE